jgi:flagellar basal-body rod protein FlgG
MRSETTSSEPRPHPESRSWSSQASRALARISQGYLENANVQAVQEMVDMITTQRAYEMNSKTIQTADQMLQRLTQLH